VKVRIILITCAAFALVVPAAQAATRGGGDPAQSSQAASPAARAAMLRGEALNRRYHLGAYRLAGNSSRPSAAELRAMTIRGNALNRKYHLGRYAPVAVTSAISADTTSPDAVARYQANATSDRSDALGRYLVNVSDNGSSASSGGGVLHSPSADVGIAAGLLLLISVAGFTLARSRHQPVRHA
jgi:hypothetical protein